MGVADLLAVGRRRIPIRIVIVFLGRRQDPHAWDVVSR